MEIFEYTDKNLRKLQLAELEMLIELDRICRKYNINYIIDAGTLLGAVRHGGFIPWDDDIDVRMLRKDYEKFCRVCKKKLDDRYFLQNHKTDDGYRWGYARILKKGTVYIRKDHEELKSKNGVFIDIFPSDDIPEKGIGYHFCNAFSWLCRKMLYSELGKIHASKLSSRIGFAFLDIFPKKWAHNGYDFMRIMFKDDKSKKVRCFGWGSSEETIGYQREWFQNTRDIRFEGIVVKAPVKTHEFLVHSYGDDYMTPPPENERRPRHTAVYIKL